ncbi:MAG: hypothetical protein K2W96_09130, partial [Gemmataceae bacterium]|nr:hypothetical protein [Gemmataceae bacterium]
MLALLLVIGAAPPPALDDSHDLVVLHPSRPYLLRLKVRVDGEPFPAPWIRQVGALFRHLDRDGDGKLSPLEAALAPSREQWRQIIAGERVIDPDPAPPFAGLARGKRFATADDLASWYGSDEAGPLRARWQAQPDSLDVLSDRLWELLRPEGEPWRKLTLPLAKAAPKLLDKLDRDEDEMLSPREILGEDRGLGMSPPAQPGLAHGPAAGGLPFFSLRPGEPLAPLESALRKAYPRGARLGPPDAVVRIDLGGKAAGPRLVGKPARGVTVRGTRAGLLIGL